ncbi:SDR family NAD(P)-dependent oxidoreductase [Paenibacillus antarcticus]|uniref:Short-chain dehydrogenase n=1 Tax=Paenibacillus antarcticus TaxID=253703 RepID=A0A168PXG0_9BACL|nr:SDR family NAD(P)-dependent oxidoreductase [Paenibacillus antarcticus]OAB47163.1 short-chain dehydrogenase [Paenibacillus antarcticus]
METVLITGASRGLGYELLKVYSIHDYITFPIVRTEEAFERLKYEFQGKCYPILADLTLDSSINHIKSEVSKQTDELDILINNAGISGTEYLIETVRTKEVNSLFDIHCLGPIRAVQSCISLLKQSDNPRIVNVSSRLGSITKMASGEFSDRDFSYSYRMVKAAQNMFTVCLSHELQGNNISVNAIHPGVLLTRGGSSDSNMYPEEAASNIYEWIKTLNKSTTGQFVQPSIGKLPW